MAEATTCCRSKTINPPYTRTWKRPFPLWQPTGPDGFGPPALPRWWQTELAQRGGQASLVTVREPKARHGRQEVRMVWALADPTLNTYVGSAGTVGRPWPQLQQILRVERERVLRRGTTVVKRERRVTYAITSVPPHRADAARLARHLRGHWGIENRAHWVRDVVWDEDRCQVRSGVAPQVLAATRNLASALLRRAGYAGIAPALRTLAARPADAVGLVLSGGHL